jgi:hypothetical protein
MDNFETKTTMIVTSLFSLSPQSPFPLLLFNTEATALIIFDLNLLVAKFGGFSTGLPKLTTKLTSKIANKA